MFNTRYWLWKPEDGAGNGGTPGDATPGPNSGDKTPPAMRQIPESWKAMSADEFNERVSKADRAGKREILLALGVKDTEIDTPEKLKAVLEKIGSRLKFAEEQERAKLTAEEAVQADLTAAQTTAETEKALRIQAEAERDQAQQQLREYILRTAISTAAADAVHPEDVYDAFARTHMRDKLAEIIDPEQQLFAEDGSFNATAIKTEAVKAIVDQCRKDRREWWQAPNRQPGSPSHGNAQPPAQNPDKANQVAASARSNIKRAMR